MNALLVSPTFPDTFWSFKHALRFIRKRCAFPPLGLLTVAAMLPGDWTLRLVDTNVQRLSDADLAWADYVLIGGMTVQRASAREIVDRCKAAGKPIIAGGPLFTCQPELFPDVDHLVLNEAEVTFPMFLNDLALGRAQRVYTSSEFPDLTRTPAPRWDLLKLNAYASMSVQYSRGCPFNCDFCNVTALFGHRPRTKTAAQVITELNGLYERGWRDGIFFVDDNLIGNKKALRTDLLPALIEWQCERHRLPLQTEASINLADDEPLMRAMVQAGFDTVFIGIETPDDAALHECNKKQNRGRDMLADVRRMQRAGLQVQGGFIVGFDSDTPSTFQRQIDFIQKSGIVTAMVGLLQAPPGTALYRRLESEGRLSGQSTGDNVDGTTNVRTLMNPDLLRTEYRRVMNRLYSYGAFYRRLQNFLREYKPPKQRVRFSFRRALTLLRSVVHLGVFSRGCVHYWRLLAWTSVRRPRQLPMAVTLWIYGDHFRRVCRLHLA